MKAFSSLIFFLATLPAAGFGGANTGLIVVAEQTASGARLTRPAPDNPSYYVAYDAGYIAAGPAGEDLKSPAATVIGRTLGTALAAEGYVPTTAKNAPSLVLVYHWGCIRPGFENRLSWDGQLDLVALEKLVRLYEKFPIEAHAAASAIVTSGPPDTLEPAVDARYFVIVSAYDYADLTQRKATLRWRLKLSAPETSGPMAEILPALAAGSGPFFGRSFDSRKNLVAQRAPRSSRETAGGTPSAEPVDAELIRTLMKQVDEFFPGETGDGSKRSRPPLPTAITQRIAAYQQEKAALQNILAKKIKSGAPGADNRLAIDVFNTENSPRIAALGRMGENIRSELARLKAATVSANADQPLDLLHREFVADVRQLEPRPADVH